MNYKDRLISLRHARVANVLQQAERDRKLRHEIAMDTLAAERGLSGLSDSDRSIIEAATIEILVVDSLFNTIPKGKRNKMVKQAVKKALDSTSADLKYVVKQIVDNPESQISKRGNYSALRAGAKMTFGYYGHRYVEIDMNTRTFTIVKVPEYATARKMIRYLAELCDVTLPDYKLNTFAFEVIHETHP